MHVNQIYYRFKCEQGNETMNIEESEITAGDLKQKIRVKKFGNAPEKFELILKDPITKRDYLDTDFIKPKTVVLVLRLPGHKSLNSGLYVQPTEDIVNKKKESAKIGDESERIKDQKEEDWDNLLMKYNVRRGHRLYLFLKDSQFFIIKCANERNLEISQQNEEWATTTFNQDKLDKAYKSCKNVILFFSVNKSTRFQGMAKMISGLTNRVSREWQTEGVRLGYSFKVKWIVTSDMLFANIGTLKALNGESIRKARDTTEIGPDVGIQIALRIDDCRKGDIDLPSTIANNPNFDFTKLSVTDKDFNAQKLLKSEETANSFDLFDDLVKKEDTSAGLPATVEEAKNSAETHLNADEEKKEERPATKMEDLKNAVPSMLPSDRTIGLPKVWEYLKYPGGYPPWFTAYLYPRKHGRSPKNRDHSSRSHHRKSRSRSRSREGSGSRHHEGRRKSRRRRR